MFCQIHSCLKPLGLPDNAGDSWNKCLCLEEAYLLLNLSMLPLQLRQVNSTVSTDRQLLEKVSSNTQLAGLVTNNSTF
jgi:hypothetical protein